MKIRHTRFVRAVLAFSTVFSLALVSGCGSEDTQTVNSATNTMRNHPQGAPTAQKPTGSADSPQYEKPGRGLAPGRDKPRIDWVEFLRNPANYLLGAADFPGGYTPRTLNLSERGKAIQDVGRAGVTVENFPSSCNGAAGRIGSADDQIAMQMASRQSHSLTLVVIRNSDPTSAVSVWGEKNDQCSTFLSQENHVTSAVRVEKITAPQDAGDEAVGYLVTTKTANLRGTTTQEQLLYAVPVGDVIIEVMGMNFGGSVNRAEVDDVLRRVLEKIGDMRKKAAAASGTDKDARSSTTTEPSVTIFPPSAP